MKQRAKRAVPKGAQPKTPRQHVIADYRALADRVDCECGWSGTSKGYPGHRREMGLANRSHSGGDYEMAW